MAPTLFNQLILADFVPQTLETMKIIFKMLSPILVPIIGVVLFATILRLILKRLLNPTPISGATGLVARIIEKKKTHSSSFVDSGSISYLACLTIARISTSFYVAVSVTNWPGGF
jgi:hypothetical protein